MRNFFTILAICISLSAFAQPNGDSLNTPKSLVQVEDTTSKTKVKKSKSPLKASLLSTFVPGAGQVYNGKYWKAPIVWGGFTGLYLMFDFYAGKQNFYHQILLYKDRGGANAPLIQYVERKNGKYSGFSGQFLAEASISTIEGYYDSARKRKQQVIIGSTVFYILQIIDATVDAHFSTFDVSDDLSLNIQPAYFPTLPTANGIKLSFNF